MVWNCGLTYEYGICSAEASDNDHHYGYFIELWLYWGLSDLSYQSIAILFHEPRTMRSKLVSAENCWNIHFVDWNSFCSTHCLPYNSKTMFVLESKSAFLVLLFPIIKVIRASHSGQSSLKSLDNIFGSDLFGLHCNQAECANNAEVFKKWTVKCWYI